MKDFTTLKGTIHLRRLDAAKPAKSEVRREIVRLIEEKSGIAGIKIAYTATGKPYISGHEQLNISISHSGNLLAVYLSGKQAVGIDIEHENNAILKAKSHFINAEEASVFKAFTMRDLHLIWGAKEAVFKYYEGKFTELENEVTVCAVEPSGIVVKSIYGEISCFYEVIDNLYLVWV